MLIIQVLNTRFIVMSAFYSVHIPRVLKHISTEQIRVAFLRKGLGKVGRIDLLKVYDTQENWVFNKAFVHFDEWFVNDRAVNLKNKIDSGEGKARVRWAESSYWMLLPNMSENIPEESIDNTNEPETESEAHAEEIRPAETTTNDDLLYRQAAAAKLLALLKGKEYGEVINIHDDPDYHKRPYKFLEPPKAPSKDGRYFTYYTAKDHAMVERQVQ